MLKSKKYTHQEVPFKKGLDNLDAFKPKPPQQHSSKDTKKRK